MFELVTIILGLVIILAGAAFMYEGWQFQKPDRVFYVGSNIREQGPRLVEIIKKYVDEPAKYHLVEPGAGLAFMASYLSTKFPWKSVQAVELGSVILFFGRIRRLLLRKKKVQFVQADIFTYDAPKPAVLYCYLTSAILTKMYQKHKFDGHLVVCLSFHIKGIEPDEIIQLKSWQEALRVYDFRKLK